MTLSDSEYRTMLDDIAADVGGVGRGKVRRMRDELPPAECIDALEAAYYDEDTEALERIRGVGRGYALKLGRWYGQREGLSGGDAESTPLTVQRLDDTLDQ